MSNGNRTLTIALTGLMAASTTHTISIVGVRDVAGNTMPTVSPTFTTGTGVDLTTPSATLTINPANNAVNVPITVAPTITFSEPMDPISILTSGTNGIYLRFVNTGIAVPATFSFSADYRTVTLTPTTPLASGTQYYLQVVYSYGVSDLAGNWYSSVTLTIFTTQ
jgi:hypothetical protein